MSGGPGADTTKTFTEEDWMEPEKLNAYGKSKTLAEKAAWDYVKELPGTSQRSRQQFEPISHQRAYYAWLAKRALW